ncbi:MAG TPA: head GIN domain-containing protein [Pyrinomonadaceae bacterium]
MNALLENSRRYVDCQRAFGLNLNSQFAIRKPKYLFVFLLAFSISATSGCHFRMHNGVSGSGNRQTQKRDIGPFTSISAEGAFEIDVTGQKPVSLEIEGDDNILPLITTDVSNNVLRITNARNYSVREPITIRISVPNLEGLSVAGAGKIAVSGVKNEKFGIDSKGAATIIVSGETGLVSIDTTGAGTIDAHKLRAAKAVVDSKGVSSIEVYANEQLDVTVSGPSHVVYEGDPKITKRINGPGSVEKKASGPA